LIGLGYDDLQFRKATPDNFVADFYSAKNNVVFLVKDSHCLCYDREAPNGNFNLKERVA